MKVKHLIQNLVELDMESDIVIEQENQILAEILNVGSVVDQHDNVKSTIIRLKDGSHYYENVNNHGEINANSM